MSDLVQETDHVGVALDKLLHQFKNAVQLNEFFTAILAPVQTVENDLWALYTERWPDVAVGQQLDNLGAIVGQPRRGLNDADYRLWIQARILINRADGTGDDTLKLLQLIIPDAEHDIRDQYPAAYIVEAFGSAVDNETVFELLRLIKPAGVRLHYVFSPETANLFRYDTIGQGYDGTAVYAGDFA